MRSQVVETASGKSGRDYETASGRPIIALADQNGSKVGTWQYTAFGKAYNVSGSASDYRYLFTGREWLAPVGLQENRARYYNPNTGRWLSRDSKYFEDGNNLYAYAHNRPIDLTDPFGTSTGDSTSDGNGGFIQDNGDGTYTHRYSNGLAITFGPPNADGTPNIIGAYYSPEYDSYNGTNASGTYTVAVGGGGSDNLSFNSATLGFPNTNTGGSVETISALTSFVDNILSNWIIQGAYSGLGGAASITYGANGDLSFTGGVGVGLGNGASLGAGYQSPSITQSSGSFALITFSGPQTTYSIAGGDFLGGAGSISTDSLSSLTNPSGIGNITGWSAMIGLGLSAGVSLATEFSMTIHLGGGPGAPVDPCYIFITGTTGTTSGTSGPCK